MIIWQGRGWVVAVVGFSCLVLAEFASEALTNDSGYYQDHRWPMAVACAAAAAIIFMVRHKLEPAKSRRVRDVDTLEEFTIHPSASSFFFIPLRAWPAVLVAVSVVLAIAEAFS